MDCYESPTSIKRHLVLIAEDTVLDSYFYVPNDNFTTKTGIPCK